MISCLKFSISFADKRSVHYQSVVGYYTIDTLISVNPACTIYQFYVFYPVVLKMDQSNDPLVVRIFIQL